MAEKQQSTPAKFKTFQNQFMPDGGEQFFLDEETADVHFSFDDGATRIAAHKIFLAAASDVFKRMFYGELKENGDVKMNDVSAAAFMEFLQYFYLNEIKLTTENIAGVIKLGDKYNVKKCFEDGIQFLIETLYVENVCTTLHLAILYDHLELIKTCETFIIVNTAAVFKSNGFLECGKGILERILKMDVFSCPEVDVFEACMAWVRAQSGEDILTKDMVDIHLGQLYDEIRFTAMSTHNFFDLYVKYGSILQNDFISITQKIKQLELKAGQFNACLRHAKWNADAIVNCDRSMGDEQTPYKLKAEYKTTFSINKPLLLGEFTCGKIFAGGHTFPCRELQRDLPVDMEIMEATDLDGTNSKTLLKMKAKLQSKDTIVSLPHPLLVRPGFFYTISIGQFPEEYCYYSNNLKTELQLACDATIKFHNCLIGYNNRVVDLIPALNFNQI